MPYGEGKYLVDPSVPWHLLISLKTSLCMFKDPLLTMTLCAPNEKQDKGNLGQKELSDNMKVDFGAMKSH